MASEVTYCLTIELGDLNYLCYHSRIFIRLVSDLRLGGIARNGGGGDNGSVPSLLQLSVFPLSPPLSPTTATATEVGIDGKGRERVDECRRVAIDGEGRERGAPAHRADADEADERAHNADDADPAAVSAHFCRGGGREMMRGRVQRRHAAADGWEGG